MAENGKKPEVKTRPVPMKIVMREYTESLIVAVLVALILRFFVISAYKIIEAWEEWLTADAISQPWKTFNLSCIRLSKGIVKAWRLLLVDLKTPQPKLAAGEETPAASLPQQ